MFQSLGVFEKLPRLVRVTELLSKVVHRGKSDLANANAAHASFCFTQRRKRFVKPLPKALAAGVMKHS